MPTYEYACRSCGHTFEIVRSMNDEALTVCPECGGELRKVFAPVAISFKGSGFYATDHGKKAKKPAEKASDRSSETSTDKPADRSSDKSSGSSSDKKGDTSAGTKGSAPKKDSPAPAAAKPSSAGGSGESGS
ncbi:MAG: FmdB family zinc ribbon protein [Acidimicrobiia bacterium]